jgi:hypothetical protein
MTVRPAEKGTTAAATGSTHSAGGGTNLRCAPPPVLNDGSFRPLEENDEGPQLPDGLPSHELTPSEAVGAAG